MAKILEMKPTPKGKMLSSFFQEKGVFYGVQMVNDLRVVSNIQLYADLFNYPARGEEAALALLGFIKKERRRKVVV